MSSTNEKSILHAMYRRWAYMVIAIFAAAFLQTRPVLGFYEDHGMIYIRSFEMDQTTYYVVQTHMENGSRTIVDTMDVSGLYICNKIMLWGAILCLLCFFNNRWRMRIAIFTAVMCGVYYALVIYYGIQMASEFYATLYPTWMIIWPAIVCQMMIMTHLNTQKTIVMDKDLDLEEVAEK